MADNVVPIVRQLDDPALDETEAREAAEYLSARGITREWAMSNCVGMEVGKRKDDRIRSGALSFSYFDHDGNTTTHMRWRLRDKKNGFNVDPKFVQRSGSGVRAYMPPQLRSKTLTISEVLSDAAHPLIV